MSKKNFMLSSLAIFFVIYILEFVIHGIILGDIYHKTAHIWRSEGEMKNIIYLMWIGYLIMAPLFIYIYSAGLNKKQCPIEQGVKFGIVIGIFTSIPTNLIWFVVLPIPAILAIAWGLAGLIECIICGLITGFLYKKLA